MENYKVVEKSKYFVDLTFMKKVKRRSTGKIELEPDNTLYGIPKINAKNYIAHCKTISNFGDIDISLKDYMKNFYVNYENS